MIQEEWSVSVFDEVLLIAAVAHSVQWLFAGEANSVVQSRSKSKQTVKWFLTYIAMYYISYLSYGTFTYQSREWGDVCVATRWCVKQIQMGVAPRWNPPNPSASSKNTTSPREILDVVTLVWGVGKLYHCSLIKLLCNDRKWKNNQLPICRSSSRWMSNQSLARDRRPEVCKLEEAQ